MSKHPLGLPTKHVAALCDSLYRMLIRGGVFGRERRELVWALSVTIGANNIEDVERLVEEEQPLAELVATIAQCEADQLVYLSQVHRAWLIFAITVLSAQPNAN